MEFIRTAEQFRVVGREQHDGWPGILRPWLVADACVPTDGGSGLELVLHPIDKDGTYTRDRGIRVLTGAGGSSPIDCTADVVVGGEVACWDARPQQPGIVISAFEPQLPAETWYVLEKIWFHSLPDGTRPKASLTAGVNDQEIKELFPQLVGECLLTPEHALTYRGRRLVEARRARRSRPPRQEIPDSPVEKKLRLPGGLVQFLEAQAGYRGNDFTAMSREILFQWAASNGYKP